MPSVVRFKALPILSKCWSGVLGFAVIQLYTGECAPSVNTKQALGSFV